MSELLAGLAGALIATVGALSVQVLVGRQRRGERRTQLIAAFLADTVQLLFHCSGNRVDTEQGVELPTPHFQFMADAFDRTQRSGLELAFLCPKDLAKQITDLLATLEKTIVDSSPRDTSNTEYDQRLNETMNEIDELSLSLHSRYGA